MYLSYTVGHKKRNTYFCDNTSAQSRSISSALCMVSGSIEIGLSSAIV